MAVKSRMLICFFGPMAIAIVLLVTLIAYKSNEGVVYRDLYGEYEVRLSYRRLPEAINEKNWLVTLYVFKRSEVMIRTLNLHAKGGNAPIIETIKGNSILCLFDNRMKSFIFIIDIKNGEFFGFEPFDKTIFGNPSVELKKKYDDLRAQGSWLPDIFKEQPLNNH